MGPLRDDERFRFDQADCLEWLDALPDGYLDLLVCSPPYELARLYLENGSYQATTVQELDAYLAGQRTFRIELPMIGTEPISERTLETAGDVRQ